MNKKIMGILAIFFMVLFFNGCSKDSNGSDKATASNEVVEENQSKNKDNNSKEKDSPTEESNKEDDISDYIDKNVKITLENGKEIIIKLNANEAPITVKNFVKLVNEGFYDGLIFHRVIKGFMIQGGDPTGTGSGGPGYSIKGEFKKNGIDNNLKHKRGVISMARSSHPDSAGSQFFIMHQDSTHLDGDYAAFGEVIEGIEAVDEIASVKVGPNDKPIEEQKIFKIEIVIE